MNNANDRGINGSRVVVGTCGCEEQLDFYVRKSKSIYRVFDFNGHFKQYAGRLEAEKT